MVNFMNTIDLNNQQIAEFHPPPDPKGMQGFQELLQPSPKETLRRPATPFPTWLIWVSVASGLLVLGIFIGAWWFLPSAPDAEAPAAAPAKEPADKKETPVKKAELGKNIFLEIQGDKRRVVIESYVCLTKGRLEMLLTRRRTKEHEAILAADIDARVAHAALQAAGAEPGKPVQFRDPKIIPPSGTIIKITLEYKNKDGKLVRLPAQQWVQNIKTKKELHVDWVFSGSRFFPDPEKKRPPFYAATDGTVICVVNFESAMLDLPIDSSSDTEALSFQAFTERIPEMGTPVRVILEPVLMRKK